MRSCRVLYLSHEISISLAVACWLKRLIGMEGEAHNTHTQACGHSRERESLNGLQHSSPPVSHPFPENYSTEFSHQHERIKFYRTSKNWPKLQMPTWMRELRIVWQKPKVRKSIRNNRSLGGISRVCCYWTFHKPPHCTIICFPSRHTAVCIHRVSKSITFSHVVTITVWELHESTVHETLSLCNKVNACSCVKMCCVARKSTHIHSINWT
jgi:hypothetical protein